MKTLHTIKTEAVERFRQLFRYKTDANGNMRDYTASDDLERFFSAELELAVRAAFEATDSEKLEPEHNKECAYQRSGCDCGFMEEKAYNLALAERDKKISDFLK